MTGYDIEVESLDTLPANPDPDPAGDRQPLFVSPLSELDRYSIPNAFDAFKF